MLSEMHASSLRLHGLSEHSAALAHYQTPTGVVGHFYAPARHCFACLAVCPAYWSNFMLLNYANKLGDYIPEGSTVWYAMTEDHPREFIISHDAPIAERIQ